MGLSVRYELSFAGTIEAARPVLVALRDRAVNFGFDTVTDLIHAVVPTPPSAPGGDQSRAAPHPPITPEEMSAVAAGTWHLTTPDPADPLAGLIHHRIPPTELLEFDLVAGGLERATFGLAAHAPHPAWPELHTVLRWKTACCTQPAGHPRLGGVKNFLKFHRLLLQVLREAQTLGLGVAVQDDGKFWETSDQKVLIDQFHHWEELTAGLLRRRADMNKPGTLAADVLPTLKPRALRDSHRTHPDT
jgi:hypothetical protein